VAVGSLGGNRRECGWNPPESKTMPPEGKIAFACVHGLNIFAVRPEARLILNTAE